MKSPSQIFEIFWKSISLLIFYIADVISCNIKVAIEVLTPGHNMRPGIIAVPLQEMSDIKITLVDNLITMTPGTLSLDVSADRSTLYVHAMDIDNLEAFRLDLVNNYVNRIKDLPI